MKRIKIKSFVISCAVCLLSILPGVILWNKLPDIVAIHFNFHNEADGFASKGVAVCGMPIFMTLLQAYCCIINDINSAKHGERRKFEIALKSIIPTLCFAVQAMILSYSMGKNIDIRRAVAIIIGIVFIVMGNYQPKQGDVNKFGENTRKISRFIGYTTVIMGIFFAISAVLPQCATVICMFLLIPYALAGLVYGIMVSRKNTQNG